MSLLGLISAGWLIFIALLVLVGLANLILGSQTYALWRFTKMASALGLSYDPEAKAFPLPGCERLPVWQVWKAHRNLLHGTVAGVETIFVEVGKEGAIEDSIMSDVFHGLVCFRQPGRSLPAFQLISHYGSPEKALDDTARARPKDFHQVELQGNPGFPNFFLLLASPKEDEGALRDLFPRPVQDFFMEHRDFFGLRDVQGAGEWVGVMERIDFVGGAKAFREELALVRRVHELFARATGQDH